MHPLLSTLVNFRLEILIYNPPPSCQRFTFASHSFYNQDCRPNKVKMSEREISEKGDLEVANARSDTSISNKEVSDSENEVVDWTPEEEKRLVRK